MIEIILHKTEKGGMCRNVMNCLWIGNASFNYQPGFDYCYMDYDVSVVIGFGLVILINYNTKFQFNDEIHCNKIINYLEMYLKSCAC